MEVVDAAILKLASVSACAARIDKDTWGTCHAAQMDMVARLDNLYGLFSRNKHDLFTHSCRFNSPKIVYFYRITTFVIHYVILSEVEGSVK